MQPSSSADDGQGDWGKAGHANGACGRGRYVDDPAANKRAAVVDANND
jgi:hypothetical protein